MRRSTQTRTPWGDGRWVTQAPDTGAGLILGLRPDNKRRRYKVTPSLIGWAQTLNQPWGVWQLAFCFEICCVRNKYDSVLCRRHFLTPGQVTVPLDGGKDARRLALSMWYKNELSSRGNGCRCSLKQDTSKPIPMMCNNWIGFISPHGVIEGQLDFLRLHISKATYLPTCKHFRKRTGVECDRGRLSLNWHQIQSNLIMGRHMWKSLPHYWPFCGGNPLVTRELHS